MAESLYIDVRNDDNGNDKAADQGFNQKVTTFERIFLIFNFILELPSAAFDQLSSVHKPLYAQLSMFISFTVLIISIIDLVYKSRKERVSWLKRGQIPWFYYPDSKPFGTFPDIIGLVLAIFQCIFATIAYAFLSRHSDNPVKVSVCPIIFSFALLYSRLSGNSPQRRSTPLVRKLYKAEKFTLADLAAATDDFSIQNKIGAGCFGAVYRGKLSDGREVAIKRRDTVQQRKKFKEDESGFESELTFLSRIFHKHLVRLFGYYENGNETILVLEYMKNGTLYDHLHENNNVQKISSEINSWKMRIKIALETARGIEYLHNYVVPPMINGDIKSSNILLDSNWTARVSDFGFPLISLESECDYWAMKAARREGYTDPEYYGRNELTAKSDVYSLGVELLELLTGKKAIFKDDNDTGKLTSVVDFTVPKILANELVNVLDYRIGLPKLANEAEAVDMVAYTAIHCVNSEGNSRPSITNVVANLEQALSLIHSGIEDNRHKETEQHDLEVLERQ